MIKVNLAKSQVMRADGTQVAFAADAAAGRLPGAPHPAVKILLVFIFPVLLYAYENYNISEKKKILIRVSAEAQKIEREVSEYGSLKVAVDNLVKEKKKLNSQLSVIEKISQKRAFKLEAIRKVQDSLLSDVWLNELVVDQNLIVFRGYARNPSSIQTIVQNLSENEVVESAMNRELLRVQLGTQQVNSFDIEVKVKQ